MSDPTEREELNNLRVEYPDLSDEAEHYYVCEECGQAVDMRRLGDVLHHEEPGHYPLPVQ
jgi:RNA polymerase-binding transcription factor DksA